jgi:uncharacterized protein DUF4038/collagenase-like protein with putative collagen-binding domain
MKISISDSGRHFIAANGDPFFWLADTAWNTGLRGDTDDWQRYLDARARQGFTVIQFVSTPWRARKTPVHGRLFEQVDGKVQYDEHAWEKMEEWLGMIVEAGLVPAPVMLWDLNPQDPFFDWSEDTCIQVGKRMLERWSRFDPVWMLGGDGSYHLAERAARWKRIGRAVFADHPDEIVTMHPCGCRWVGDSFADEPWYSFVGIQSGHGSSPGHLGFLLNGPYAQRWQEIRKPFVNLEPNYEHAHSYHEELVYDAFHIRRASYWSLLGAPPAGVTYGHNSIWIWSDQKGEHAEGHGAIWVGDAWTDALDTPGVESLGVMRSIFSKLPWTQMLPADHLLIEQPGWADVLGTVKVSATPSRSCVAAYLPVGGRVELTKAGVPSDIAAHWVDPRTGRWTPIDDFVQADILAADAPDEQDWLLVAKV